MKYLFSILFIFSFYFSYSQITVSEMIKIYNMDMDQFETYALKRGFTLGNVFNKEDRIGIRYHKNYNLYITLYSILSGDRTVSYGTNNAKEFLNIKNQLNSLGYTFQLRDNVSKGGVTVENKIYSSGLWEIELISAPENQFQILLRKQL